MTDLASLSVGDVVELTEGEGLPGQPAIGQRVTLVGVDGDYVTFRNPWLPPDWNEGDPYMSTPRSTVRPVCQ
jgi:hypothetical protein